MSVVEPSNVIFGKIDRISNSGNGMLDHGDGEIAIGPVKRSAIGERVHALVWSTDFAFCLSEFARKENYKNTFKALTNQLLSDPPDDCPAPGEVILAPVGSPNSSGHTHGEYKGIPVRVRHIFATDRDLPRKDECRLKVLRVERGRIIASSILSIEVRDKIPERGEKFTAVVAHKSQSGKGLVESFTQGVVNIGPIRDEAVGSSVDAVMVEERSDTGTNFAYCLSEEATTENYPKEMRKHLEDEIAQASAELLVSLTDRATTEREKKSISSSGGYRRDPVFGKNVKEAYDYSCAVCGAKRTAPNGASEVEAAHIYPVSGADGDEGKGGPDEVGNGISLCRMHHWAFDNGWFALEDDYTIVVRDRPNLPGYEEIAEYDGKQIELPEDEKHHPEVEFVRAHRLRIWE